MSKGGGSVKTPKPEDYIGLVNAQADANRIDQQTPFGSITYGNKKPMSYKKWSKQNPAGKTTTKQFSTNDKGEQTVAFANAAEDNRDAYRDYKKSVSRKGKAKFQYSPELQSLFNTQFDPDSYSQYEDDYMGRYNELIAPNREDQLDQFQQGMFNRGLPDTSEVYGDVYRNTVGDPNARQDLMAQQQAQSIGDQRRMQDWNRLMAAMGGSQMQIPQIDALGAANLPFNANMTNAANQQAQNSDMWNSAATAGTAALMFMCSRDYKEHKEPVQVLDSFLSLPVEKWKYKDGISDEDYHINTYSEDFHAAFGLGGDKQISIIDMIGVTMKAVQELAIEVRELKKCQQ